MHVDGHVQWDIYDFKTQIQMQTTKVEINLKLKQFIIHTSRKLIHVH